MHRFTIVLAPALVSFAAAIAMTHPAQAALPCPPDINCSGGVDLTDLLSVISNWGTSGNASDVDGSGLVELNDLLAVIGGWGPCLFDFGPAFPNAEAHQIGLEMLGPAGPLSLPQATYDRIDRDLALIRAAYPALASETHSEAWVPNQMLVSLVGSDMSLYNCFNTFHQLTLSDHLFSNWYTLTFAGKYNVLALSEAYMALAAVEYAEPNGMIGGQNFWRPTDLGGGVWSWDIDDGFHDCFDGCDCHNAYTIEIDAAGKMSLISFEQFGMPWCKFN